MCKCDECKYCIYDSSTDTYLCKVEDILSEADFDDLTDTGGENCSQFVEADPDDYEPSIEISEVTPGQLHEILSDIFGE